MTGERLVILLGCVVVLVWSGEVTAAEECPEGASNGSCASTTQYNNEVEESTTMEMTTHIERHAATTKLVDTTETTETTDLAHTELTTTPELMTEMPKNHSLSNALSEELSDNDISPTAIPSIIPLSPVETTSPVSVVQTSTSSAGKLVTTTIRESTETTSLAVSSTTEAVKDSTEPPSTVAGMTEMDEEHPTVVPGIEEIKLKTEMSSTHASVTEEDKDHPTTVSGVDGMKLTTETSSTTQAAATEEDMEHPTTMSSMDEMKLKTEMPPTTHASVTEEEKEHTTFLPGLNEVKLMMETSSHVSTTEEEREHPTRIPDLNEIKKEGDRIESRTEMLLMHSAVTDASKEVSESSTMTMVSEEAKETTEMSTTEEHEESTVVAATVTPLENEVSHRSFATIDEPKGRALNFTVEEEDPNNVILSNSSSYHHDYDLSEVPMDHEDEFDVVKSKILAPKYQLHNSTLGICEKGGLTYENGEKLELGCDSVCTCRNGKMDCAERCASPFFRKGKKIEDPLCSAKEADDPCCSVLVCTGDTETEPLEICSYENATYNRGDKFNKECAEVCTCEAAGKITCKARCLPISKTSDRCVEVPDPNDPCCKKVLCDVTLEDHDSEKDDEKPRPKLLSAKYVNSTAIMLTFDSKFEENESLPDVEVSNDQSNWTYYRLLPGDVVFVKDHVKYLKVENAEEVVEVDDSGLESVPSVEVTDNTFKDCQYKDRTFKIGEEYNDNCEFLCICLNGHMKCLKIECPTYFGVDVLDANCVEWETVPPNFSPSPPNCCPEKVRCKDNGSCDYEGRTYKNWDELPSNVTGCEKKCYCEMGKVECQNTCPPVTALPPPNLPCPPHMATISHTPNDDCCKEWVCNTETTSPDTHGDMYPGNFPGFTNPPQQEEVIIQSLEAVDPHTVRLSFSVPPIIVGLHGRVEVRYTHDKSDDDMDSWMLTVFAPPNDLIATPSLVFNLMDLKADTLYKVKVTVTLRDLQNTPTSRIHTITTPKEVHPPIIPINPDLAITDINATWVTVVWRPFTQYELSFIDGLQLRYKEIDGRIFTATPLIHRAETKYTLEKLKPNTKYEIGIYFIPFPGQMTELRSENMLHFTTANEIDTYGFNVTLELAQIKSQSIEISWSGVPYPEDKYVNIYRVIYQSDSGKEDQSTFKMAKRDSPARTLIKELKPGTRYRIWLEVYLTNGKIKMSNVEDFVTKPRVAPALGSSTQQDKLSRAEVIESKGDYYGPLVIVAILAAIAILSTLVLLLILVRRHNQNKAAITPPSTRISQSAYDNPTYKVEIQQETMGL